MTTVKKLRRRTEPINESREDEIDRLVREQGDDARHYEPQKRGHVSREGDTAELPVSPPGVRLGGDELREHVRWLAQRELSKKKLQIPQDLRARFGRDSTRRSLDQRAVILQRKIADAIEHARAFVNDHDAREGGACFVALADLVAALDQARIPYGALAALGTISDRLRDFAHLPPQPFDDEIATQAALAEAYARAPRSRVAPPIETAHGALSLREAIARRLGRERGWTAPKLACASLILGSWPETIDADELVDPLEVLRIEANTMKQTRKRRVPRLGGDNMR